MVATSFTPASNSDTYRAEPWRALGRILLASDGTASADAAFVIARQLAARTGADVHVLSVLEPLPVLVPAPDMLLAPPLEWDTSRAEQMRAGVRRQMREAAAQPRWTLEVQLDRPVPAIAHVAKQRQANLIITGLRRHNVLDYLLGGETPLHAAQHAEIPLLAIAPGTNRLPRTMLVAVDFTPTSVHATHVALELFPETTKVFLVHVRPRIDPAADEATGWERAYESGIPAAFEHLMKQLPQGLSVEPITLRGNTAAEIVDFADYARVDLVVAGIHRRGILRRLLPREMLTKLMRGTTCSVLLVPETPAGQLGELAGRPRLRTLVLREPTQWSDRLREFTRRNAGRRVTLEVDDGELGAQAQAFAYPLLGVDFDKHDERVQIMLGDAEPGGRHLTRSVSNPISIEIVQAREGADTALRVAHGAGQTLLMFTP
ncbi:MAG TPA: universal stress protein [Gemmatimonadaceae bacterium]|nr:universal stress protein [Gemmatimonadaceae bacterium]